MTNLFPIGIETQSFICSSHTKLQNLLQRTLLAKVFEFSTQLIAVRHQELTSSKNAGDLPILQTLELFRTLSK